MSTVTDTITIPNVQLTLDQLVAVIRQLEPQARTKIVQMLSRQDDIEIATSITNGIVDPMEKIGEPYSFFEVASSLNVDGPPDWSENLDAYLYGGKLLDE